MTPVSEWNWTTIGAIIGVVVILISVYQMIESSEAETRAEMRSIETDLKLEMRRVEADLKAEMRRIEAARQADKAELRAEIAALSAKMDAFIERVDSRLDEVEREQARLSAVNDLLSQQSQR